LGPSCSAGFPDGCPIPVPVTWLLRSQPPPPRSVHAVLPHTAHRRRSPPAFGFPRQDLFGLGATTIPTRLARRSRAGARTPTSHRPNRRPRRWRLLRNSPSRICAYQCSCEKRRAELPYLKYAAQPLRNQLISCTTISTGTLSRDRSVNSRSRSRACCIALSAGQRARKVIGRFP